MTMRTASQMLLEHEWHSLKYAIFFTSLCGYMIRIGCSHTD
jgi:hypothetical protein